MKARSNKPHAAMGTVACTLACALVLSFAVSTGARAGQNSGQGDDAGAAKASPPAQETRVRHEFGQTITEYVRNGEVFMMTVKPRGGPTQYWDDPDGDGQFQSRTSNSIDDNVNLPKWRLGGW